MIRYIAKISFVLSLILSNPCTGYAQENTSNIKVKQIADKMFTDIFKKDFDAILDMTHPKVFELVPKDQMKELIRSMFEGNDEFKVEILNNSPEYKLSDVFKGNENNMEYAFLSYDMKMKMIFKNQEFDDDAKKMMIPIMKAKGMEVEFVSNNAMKVLMRDRLTILVKEDATENKWVMVNYDPDSPLFYQILSTDLLEKAKDYNQNLLLESKKERED